VEGLRVRGPRSPLPLVSSISASRSPLPAAHARRKKPVAPSFRCREHAGVREFRTCYFPLDDLFFCRPNSRGASDNQNVFLAGFFTPAQLVVVF
jgi:hypothetical protein